jgi:hypothetical protein
MSQSPLSVFMNGYLDPAQVSLGRLVLDLKNPGQNFCPHSVLTLSESDISKAAFSDLKSLANAESSSHFKTCLSIVLKIFARKSHTAVDDISTRSAINHQLLNVNLKFESLFENDEVKIWLEKVILTGSSVYMVVGLHTLQDASVSLNREASTEISGQVQAPITDAMAPGASLLPGVGGASNMKIGGGHTSTNSIGASFVAPGERIIAVQYKKVVFQMSSSKDAKTIGNAALEKKTRWKSFGAARGGTDLDTFEATLAERTTAADIEEDVDVEAESIGPGGVFVILS